MVIRMGPGGADARREADARAAGARWTRSALRAARQDVVAADARLVRAWRIPRSNVTYTYAGEAESPDGKADVIDVKDADGFTARLFIDQQTHLPLMLTYQGPQRRVMTAGGPMTGRRRRRAGAELVAADERRGPQEDERQTCRSRSSRCAAQPPTMVEYRLFFADWTDVDGIKFPMKLQRATGGTTDEEWTITKVKVNPKIDPKKFDSQS